MILTLAEIARLTGSQSSPPERTVSEYSIDTRTLVPGAVYFALKGDLHDGHKFLAAAAERGAAAAIVDRRDWRETPELPLQVLPKPKIIDASVRQQGNDKKPSLAELMSDRKKKTTHLPPEFAHFKDYVLPSFDLLDEDDGSSAKPADKSQLLAVQNIIVETLSTFGIQVTPGDITRGPTITRYEI